MMEARSTRALSLWLGGELSKAKAVSNLATLELHANNCLIVVSAKPLELGYLKSRNSHREGRRCLIELNIKRFGGGGIPESA